MKRLAPLLVRAVLASLLLVSVLGGVAAADDGQNANVNTTADDQGPPGSPGPFEILLPEDPGFPH